MTPAAPPEPPAGDGAARVVVVGAGFGGLAAVRKLARSGARTTLIDRNIYSTFQPLLYEVASAGLSGSDVAYPVRAVSRRHGAVFRHGELAAIEPAARQIVLSDGARLGYDYLILATGVTAAYHGVPGAAGVISSPLPRSYHARGVMCRPPALVTVTVTSMTGTDMLERPDG